MQSLSPVKRWSADPIPASAGVGLKPLHYSDILNTAHPVGFFEFHAENYMCGGGAPHRYLAAVRDQFPLSMHGVGLSIGADQPLDKAHLNRLADLNDRYRPALFSEHLAWSSHGGAFFNDLLPVPYNSQSLDVVVGHIDEVQAAIGRQMLLENPSTYVAFETSTMAEVDFLGEIVLRTGCGLLLDVNNVHVSAVNHNADARRYLDAFPIEHVGEIHLAGHAPDTDNDGNPLLIDAHDRPVADPVWNLYEYALSLTGPVPTLIEWDNDIPDWPILVAEAERAIAILDAQQSEAHHATAR